MSELTVQILNTQIDLGKEDDYFEFMRNSTKQGQWRIGPKDFDETYDFPWNGRSRFWSYPNGFNTTLSKNCSKPSLVGLFLILSKSGFIRTQSLNQPKNESSAGLWRCASQFYLESAHNSHRWPLSSTEWAKWKCISKMVLNGCGWEVQHTTWAPEPAIQRPERMDCDSDCTSNFRKFLSSIETTRNLRRQTGLEECSKLLWSIRTQEHWQTL